MRKPAISLAPLAALAALLLGCAPSHTAAKPPSHDESASAPAARCAAADLDAAFLGVSQPGTGGTALGLVLLWDKSAAACRLGGPVTVTGLDGSGKRVTMSVGFGLPARPALPLLSANGAGPDSSGRFPAGEASASLLLMAAGAHPAPGAPCTGHQVNPAVWRIGIGEGSLTAPNASKASGPALTVDGGLVTCRGRLGGQSPLSVSRA
jgi:hypothetical protein